MNDIIGRPSLCDLILYPRKQILVNFFDTVKIKLLQSKSVLMVDVSYFWLPYQNGRLKGAREGGGPWTLE